LNQIHYLNTTSVSIQHGRTQADIDRRSLFKYNTCNYSTCAHCSW